MLFHTFYGVLLMVDLFVHLAIETKDAVCMYVYIYFQNKQAAMLFHRTTKYSIVYGFILIIIFRALYGLQSKTNRIR